MATGASGLGQHDGLTFSTIHNHMNISPFTIYLWQLCDRITPALIVFGILLSIATVIMFICHLTGKGIAGDQRAMSVEYPHDKAEHEAKAAEADAYAELMRRYWSKTVVGAVLLIGGAVAIPSSNTVAMMVIIPEIAQSKMVQQDLPDLYNAAVEALKNNITK